MTKKIIIFYLFYVVVTLAHSKAQPSSTSNAPETNMNSKQVFSPVHCSINCISNDQQMWVNITFSNVMESSVTFLERNLVRTSDLTWSPFQVSRNGQNVPYMGLTIKRPPPTASEFYHMKPHEVVNTRIEIGKFYDFSSSGNYVIKYIAVNPPFQTTSLFIVQSDPVIFKKR